MSQVNVDMKLTAEQQTAIDKALNRRGQADYECFMLLQRIRPYINNLTNVKDEVDDVLKEREKANRDFVRALTGR